MIPMAFFYSTLGRVALGAVAVLGFGVFMFWQGWSAKGDKVERQQIEATVKQLQQRGQINADVSNEEISSICVELGGNPDDCRMQPDSN